MSLRTYQPKKRQRAKVQWISVLRMATENGRKVLAA